MVDKNLIFLISQPRSGSTLLQKILSNHKDIETVGEPWILLPGLINNFSGNIRSEKTPYGVYTANRAINYFEKEIENRFNIHKNALKAYYLEKYKGIVENKTGKFFLDKTPRYYYIINELIELFPEAKIIVLLRNPLAVLNSIIHTWTKRKYFKIGLFKDDLVLAPKIFSRIKQNNNSILFVKYEDLILDSTTTLKYILNYLKLDYQDGIEKHKEERSNDRWVLGDPENVYKFKSFEKESVDSWKRSLSKRKFRRLAHSYINLLEKNETEDLGYSFKQLRDEIKKAGKNRFSIPAVGIKFYFNPISVKIGKIIKLWEAFKRKIL